VKLRKHLTIGLALVGLALGLATAPASAQSILRGTFELPTAAYFGNTLLQPGQYTIWTSTEIHDIAHVPAIHLNGEGVRLTFLAVATPAKESGRNFLDVANIDGTYVIKAFDAGSIGESFAFSVTKSVKNKALRASSEAPIAVALAAE
jgi:hypothetical protein